MPAALRALLAGVVDYAGLFPPASLPMREACGNFASYRSSADAWMLGRFVVPASRLPEFASELRALRATAAAALEWRVAVILSADLAADLAAVRAFNAGEGALLGAVVDVVEGRVGVVEDVRVLASWLPSGVTAYCEVALGEDPGALVSAISAAGLRAKMRTGGVVAEAIPSAGDVVRFLRACHSAGVTAKATAGLHHPMRAEQVLTYEVGAARAVMHGYLNVLLCAAVIAAGGSDAEAEAVLAVREAGAIGFKGTQSLAFQGVRVVDTLKGTESIGAAHVLIEVGGVEKLLVLDAEEVARMRRDALVGFGSCSFREPVDEVRALLARFGSVEPA